MPRLKSQQVESVLTRIAGLSRDEAAVRKICVLCRDPITDDIRRDPLTLKEYTISGLCAPCQDRAFGADLP